MKKKRSEVKKIKIKNRRRRQVRRQDPVGGYIYERQAES